MHYIYIERERAHIIEYVSCRLVDREFLTYDFVDGFTNYNQSMSPESRTDEQRVTNTRALNDDYITCKNRRARH